MKKKHTKEDAKLASEQIDELHEAGADMRPYQDWANARRPGREVQRVNVDFPKSFLEQIDREADRIGVTRQAWIKTAIARELQRAG